MDLTSRLTKRTAQNLLPIIITTIFGVVSSYILFFHHPYWFEFDGILYYKAGVQILTGDGYNVKQFDAPIGGPVFYVMIDFFVHDIFLTMKIITILSGVGIVFFSFFIVRNIFNYKIALLTQILTVVNVQLLWTSTHIMNDIFPFFLISVSLYFITKQELKLIDLIIVGVLFGISSMMRIYAIIGFISILIYLLIRRDIYKIKISHLIVFSLFFIISISPLVVYDYLTHGVLHDSDPSLFIIRSFAFQTPEWHNAMQEAIINEQPFNIFLDFKLFLTNYFYQLFFWNASILFNFYQLDNISIVPIIPFIGMIPVVGGIISCLNLRIERNILITILVTTIISFMLILIFGDFRNHFMVLIALPLISIGIIKIREVKENLLPLLIFPLIFLLIVAMGALGRGYQLFPIFISISILSSIFIIETIPKIISKILKRREKRLTQKITVSVVVIVITLLIMVNLGYSYKVLQYSLYDNVTVSSLENEIYGLSHQNEKIIEKGWEYKIIGDILSQQPKIEDSYVMATHDAYSFYSNSKFLYTDFIEGKTNNSINDFMLRKDWTEYERVISNLHSMPIDRHDLFDPKPDYLIFEPKNHTISYFLTPRSEELNRILSDPNNKNIPDNFKVMYQNKETGRILYKIEH